MNYLFGAGNAIIYRRPGACLLREGRCLEGEIIDVANTYLREDFGTRFQHVRVPRRVLRCISIPMLSNFGGCIDLGNEWLG